MLFSLLNCTSTNTAASSDSTPKATTPKNEIQVDQMIENGFSKGTITTNKSEGCPFILTVDTYSDQLDPINLGDFFKSDEVPDLVWVKFGSLRMPSRCNEARPVSIIEIKVRDE